MKVYVNLDEQRNILSFSTLSDVYEVELENPVMDFSKLAGYQVDDGKLLFNEARYQNYLNTQKQVQALQLAQRTYEALAKENVLDQASDEDAYTMRFLYPAYSPDSVAYQKDDRLMYQDHFYKVLQDHVSQLDWPPDTATIDANTTIPGTDERYWKEVNA